MLDFVSGVPRISYLGFQTLHSMIAQLLRFGNLQ